MKITITELKSNLEKYLVLSNFEDIYITKRRKIISKLCAPYTNKEAIVESLLGVIGNSITLEEAREERLSRL